MMRLEIDRTSKTPLFMQIALALRDRILSGLLPEGYPLPPERDLAGKLGVNRSTVVKAYQELKADGFLEARVGSGTVVRHYGREREEEETAPLPMDWDALFTPARTSPGDFFREMLFLGGREDVISFASGFPDPELFPTEVFSALQREMLAENAESLYRPSPVEGSGPLRESLVGLMEERGIPGLSPRNVMVLSGSQQGLDFLARAFLSPGDVVLAEDPTFFGALEIFRAAGARVIGVPTDGEGMRTDLLPGFISRHSPRLIYTLPTFQNPSGVTLSLERRLELLETATSAGVPVVEDDLYGEIRFSGTALPPLKALDRGGCVIYLSSFSKVLSLGLRVGWAAAPQAVIERFSRLKQMTDLHVNTTVQILLDRFLRGGHYPRHLESLREVYSGKRDALVSAMSRLRGRVGWDWEKPLGGFYLWCRLPGTLSMRTFMSRAADHGVAFLPGEFFRPDGARPENRIRLNFTGVPSGVIKEGVERLALAAEESLEVRTSGPSSGGSTPLV